MVLFVYKITHRNLKAYYAILVRRSNFRHQASPRVSPRESTQRRKVELWARNVREFCLNADLDVTFRDLLHAVKLRHGADGFTSPPKEGVLRIFFALKIRRLWPGANPRTWVPNTACLTAICLDTNLCLHCVWSKHEDCICRRLKHVVETCPWHAVTTLQSQQPLNRI